MKTAELENEIDTYAEIGAAMNILHSRVMNEELPFPISNEKREKLVAAMILIKSLTNQAIIQLEELHKESDEEL